MDEQIYKTLEITGTSNKSIESAIENALERTSKTVRNLRWFQVSEIRGGIQDDTNIQWQVILKISFDIEE